MSQPAAKALDLPFELVYDDGGCRIENPLHFNQIRLLTSLIDEHMASRGRTDFYTGGDVFSYYSLDGAEPKEKRQTWVGSEYEGRPPDLILELLTPSTEKVDRLEKMKRYSRFFRNREHYLYDFDTNKLDGFRLAGDLYQPMRPDEQGRLRSEVLGVDLGLWKGRVEGETADWVRCYYPDGSLIPTSAERADAAERRAQAAEAEIARLRALSGGAQPAAGPRRAGR